MPKPTPSYLLSLRNLCLCVGSLFLLFPAVAYGFTESTAVGPGTLSWTVNTTNGTCLGGNYTQYTSTGFSFKSGSTTTSLGGQVTWTDSSCGNYGPPVGPNPTMLTFTATAFTIVFTPYDDGGGSGTYQAAAPTTYTVYPAYKVLNIVYLPPGDASTVGYSTDVTEGTTSTIGNSFVSGTAVDFTVSVGFAFWKSTWDYNYSYSTTKSNATTFTQTIDSTTQATYASPSDPENHANDRISVWLNPAVTLSATPGSPITYSVFPKDVGIDGNRVVDSCTASVGQLQNPKLLTVGQLVPQTIDGVSVPGLLNLCQSGVAASSCTAALAASSGCGCVASDFADIVAQDPFYHSGVAANATAAQVNTAIPNRLVYLRTDTLDYGIKDTIKITDSTSSASTYSTTNKDTVGWTKGFSVSFPPIFSSSYSNTKTLTWTDSMSFGPTDGTAHSQTAFYNSTNASCFESVDIYEDTVYHSFVFFEDTPGACPAP